MTEFPLPEPVAPEHVDLITLVTAGLAFLLVVGVFTLTLAGKRSDILEFGLTAALGYFFGNSRAISTQRGTQAAQVANTQSILKLSDTLENGPKHATQDLSEAMQANTRAILNPQGEKIAIVPAKPAP